MDKKKKNLQEMRKLGFSQKTLSLMTESQIEMILEKIKKKESKEATITYGANEKVDVNKIDPAKMKKNADGSVSMETTEATITYGANEKIDAGKIDPGKMKKNADGSVSMETTEGMKRKETKEMINKQVLQPRKNPADAKTVQDIVTKTNPNMSVELDERKKTKKKKYNPWAVCTASVGRKNKKKFEDCVMGVKKKLKEGRNPYEYLIESKMEEIVENNLSPKMTKGELLRIIAEKKMMMKKPISRGTVLGGEMGEGDTKTAPAPSRTTEKEPARRTANPGRKERTQPNPKPKAKSDSELESKKSEIITAIFNLIDKESK